MKGTVGYIYSIKNNKTGQHYVGQHIGVDVNNRWRQHKRDGCKSSPTSKIGKAIKCYGVDNFTFSLLETVYDDSVNERERYWIDELNCLTNGYNIQKSCNNNISPTRRYYFDVGGE